MITSTSVIIYWLFLSHFCLSALKSRQVLYGSKNKIIISQFVSKRFCLTMRYSNLLSIKLQYVYGSTILFFLFSDQMKNAFLEANFKTLGSEKTFDCWLLMYCVEDFGKLSLYLFINCYGPSPKSLIVKTPRFCPNWVPISSKTIHMGPEVQYSFKEVSRGDHYDKVTVRP